MSFASYLLCDLCYLSKSRDEYEHEPFRPSPFSRVAIAPSWRSSPGTNQANLKCQSQLLRISLFKSFHFLFFFIFLRTLVKRAHVKQTHELNLGFGFSDGQNSSQHIFFYNTVLLYYIFYQNLNIREIKKKQSTQVGRIGADLQESPKLKHKLLWVDGPFI